MDKTISLIHVDVIDLAAALEFFRQAFPEETTLELGETEGVVSLGATNLLLHLAPDAGPRFAVWFTISVPDLACVTRAGRKVFAKKFGERIRSDGLREVTCGVTQGLAITFKGPRRRRPTINKRSSQASNKKTGKRRLPRVSSV